MRLLYQNADKNVYLVAGRKVAVSSALSGEAVVEEISRRFGLTRQQVDALDGIETRLESIDLGTIDQLTGGATPAQLVSALKQLRSALGELRAILRFHMLEEQPQLPGND